MKKLIIVAFITVIVSAGCYYDKAQLVYPQNPGGCDTTNVTLSGQLNPILTSQCLACHGGTAAAGAGIKLDNYNTLKAMALGGTLMAAINHTGPSKMPKGGAKLPQCDIDKFQAWINKGAPNN